MALRVIAVAALLGVANAVDLGLKIMDPTKTANNEHLGSYEDKNHMIGKHGAPRSIVINGNGGSIIGKDTENDLWEVKLALVSHNNAGTGHIGDELSIDFSSKGGPKDIKGVVTAEGIKFDDGNVWLKANKDGVDHPYCMQTCKKKELESLGALFEEIDTPKNCMKQCQIVYPNLEVIDIQ